MLREISRSNVTADVNADFATRPRFGENLSKDASPLTSNKTDLLPSRLSNESISQRELVNSISCHEKTFVAVQIIEAGMKNIHQTNKL